jgi:hypothetical protein
MKELARRPLASVRHSGLSLRCQQPTCSCMIFHREEELESADGARTGLHFGI